MPERRKIPYEWELNRRRAWWNRNSDLAALIVGSVLGFLLGALVF